MSDITGITTQDSSTAGDTALAGIKTAVGNLNTDKQEKGSGVTGNIAKFGASNVLGDTGKVAPTGAIVGDTDTQALTNKDLSSGTNTLPTTAATLAGSQILTNKTISGASNTLTVREADLSLIDVTTNDVSTSKHGLTPKLPNDATKFLNGVGAFAIPSTSAVSMIALGGPISLPASATSYFDTMGTGFGVISTETDIGFIIPAAGTLSNLYLRSKETLNGTAGQTIVYTVMKNGVASGITITQTVGDVSQIYSDLTHTLAVAAGDRITIRAVAGAITSNSGRLSGGGIKFA